MEHLETRLVQLNNKLLKLAEHKALLYNGRYTGTDVILNNGRYTVTGIVSNSNIINDQADNDFKDSVTDSNDIKDAKNIETTPVEHDTIEEVEPQEEVGSQDPTDPIDPQGPIGSVGESDAIDPTGPSELYSYKRSVILVSEDYTATMDDYYIGVKSEISVTITIPCDCDDGHEIVVKSEMKQPLDNIRITIISMDDENLCSINGELEYIMDLPYQSVRFICRGNSWWTI
jgi:hypothetical protein